MSETIQLNPESQSYALFITNVVRTAIEKNLAGSLTPQQMTELNPVIANAINSALHAVDHYEDSPQAVKFVNTHSETMPDEWELPDIDELLKEPPAPEPEFPQQTS